VHIGCVLQCGRLDQAEGEALDLGARRAGASVARMVDCMQRLDDFLGHHQAGVDRQAGTGTAPTNLEIDPAADLLAGPQQDHRARARRQQREGRFVIRRQRLFRKFGERQIAPWRQPRQVADHRVGRKRADRCCDRQGLRRIHVRYRRACTTSGCQESSPSERMPLTMNPPKHRSISSVTHCGLT